MKNKILVVLCVLLSLYLIMQLNTVKSDYKISTSKFTEVSISELEEIQEEEGTFYLYTGRETCPYCLAFVPKLEKAVVKNNSKVYYLDSENTNDNPKIKKIRKKYGISTVPNFTKFSGKILLEELLIREELTLDDIVFFLE